jgi:hypothetical protein
MCCIGVDANELGTIDEWMDGLADDGGVARPYLNTPKQGPPWNLKRLAPNTARTRPADWVIKRHEGYYCKVCRDSLGPAKEVWVTNPCTNKDMNKAISKHHKGDQHQAHLNERTGSKSQVRHLEDLNTQEMIAITKRMRDDYLLVKKNRPLSDFSDLVHLGALNGSFVYCSGLSLLITINHKLALSVQHTTFSLDALTRGNATYKSWDFSEKALNCIANIVSGNSIPSCGPSLTK